MLEVGWYRKEIVEVGVRRMTKRFTYVKNNSITQYQALPIQEIGKGKALHCQGIVDKLNKLTDENEKLQKEKQQLKNNLLEIEKIINNRLDNNVVPKWSDGKTELFVEEKVGYWHALAQLKKKLIRSELLFQNEKKD